ncbi:MAG: hypothetical protein IT270_02490, partial [Saprospiraceae bacterium]|nr:hypothetical protein [Saprospiraceae bacterium]
MKKALLFIFAVVLLQAPSHAQKSITLDDCFTYFKFYATGVNHYHYLNDGYRYAEANAKGLHIYDVRNPKADSLINLKLPEKYQGFDHFTFSADEKKLLLRTDSKPVYRHSTLASYLVYDLVKG